MNKIFAGIGARKTPDPILNVMTSAASQLCAQGWQLRSGNARGADQAFQKGMIGINAKEIHLPWDGYNYGRTENPSFVCPKPVGEVLEIAATYHPAWDKLSVEAKLFMVRNVTIILGLDLKSPVEMVICWTYEAAVTGGTGHAIKVAYAHNVPIFNLSDQEDWPKLIAFTEKYD